MSELATEPRQRQGIETGRDLMQGAAGVPPDHLGWHHRRGWLCLNALY